MNGFLLIAWVAGVVLIVSGMFRAALVTKTWGGFLFAMVAGFGLLVAFTLALRSVVP